MSYLLTAESVTSGHPDKVCDYISDSILDEILSQDKNARVACETTATTGLIHIMGEVTTTANYNVEKIVRKALNDIGYCSEASGFNGNTCGIINSIHEQSHDIALGTNDIIGGSGDQGIMTGYATNETDDYMPLPIHLAHRLAYQLELFRKSNGKLYLKPDGKTQVTCYYNNEGFPVSIDTILISTSHISGLDQAMLKEALWEHVVKPVIPVELIDNDTKFMVNPTGQFVICGPDGDSGLTGRKIVVDNYGPNIPVGGGAFSSKDPTKMDRTGAYMARYIAKNLVANKYGNTAQVQLAYAIGVPEPVSVDVVINGRHNLNVSNHIKNMYDLTPAGIISFLNLKEIKFAPVCNYGHMGLANGIMRPWERIDQE